MLNFKGKRFKPEMKNILVITDPGLDPDDVVTAWMLARLHQEGGINLLGSIANFSPSTERALLLRGVYDSLGCDRYVGVGTNCNSTHSPKDYEFDFPFGEYSDLSDGFNLLYWLLDNQEDNSVTLLLISGLTDIYLAQQNFEPLLKQKLKEVYIMGGASWGATGVIADPTASNNKFDPTLNAQLAYDWFINNQIPLNVLTRNAAYATSVSPSFYDLLAEINEVGAYLKRIQSKAIMNPWNIARSGTNDRLTTQWFAKRFCDLSDLDPVIEDPWPYVKKLSLYDPLTLVWMLYPDLFSPSFNAINGVEHSICGLSDNESGVECPDSVIEHINHWLY